MKKTFFAITILMFLSACVVVHEGHIPPDQSKKQMAPGQMKKWK